MDSGETRNRYGNFGEEESSRSRSEETGFFNGRSDAENGYRDRSSAVESSEWSSIIEKFVLQMETVSSHFRYTEEYVLDHSVDWLQRKYKQSIKEQWERSQERIVDGFKSISLILDGVFNGGKGMDDLLPNSFEDALEQQQNTKKETSKFITGQWWKK